MMFCVQHVRRTNTALRVYKIVAVVKTATVTTSLETVSANPATRASTVLEVTHIFAYFSVINNKNNNNYDDNVCGWGVPSPL